MMTKSEEDKIFLDAKEIGKVMMQTIRQMAKDQNRPLHDFTDGAIQALIAVGGVLLDSDHFTESLKKDIVKL